MFYANSAFYPDQSGRKSLTEDIGLFFLLCYTSSTLSIVLPVITSGAKRLNSSPCLRVKRSPNRFQSEMPVFSLDMAHQMSLSIPNIDYKIKILTNCNRCNELWPNLNLECL